VDAYIAAAPAFAQPVLDRVRSLVHKACPTSVEEMKWSRPFFLYNGVILCNLSAFKAHCSLGFWGAEMGHLLKEDGVLQDGAMGSLGRITSISDLPPEKQLLGYIRKAAELIDAGLGDNRMTVARRVAKAPKPTLKVPAELTAALAKSKKANAVFTAFSPSCQREYIEWIASAKRPETRDRRVAQAIEWMADGKQRNWKYQEC